MLAILLTHDAQLGLAELVHKTYADLWPAHPLNFRVPVNGSAAGTALAYLDQQPNCDLIPAPAAIGPCMRELLGDIPDTAWVFWSIDDRFPVWLDQPGLDDVLAGLDSCAEQVEEVKLLHWREGLTRGAVTVGAVAFRAQAPGTRQWGFWHHHFIRAGALRRVFIGAGRPDVATIQDVLAPLRDQRRGRAATERDYFRGTALIPERPLITLGEPLIRGRLTRNGRAELLRFRCQVPAYSSVDKDCVYSHGQ